MSTKITEIIPSDMPEWFNKDMKDGQLFCRMVKRLEAQRDEISKLKAKVNKLEQLWASKDVSRYNYLFIDGFDYHDSWVCRPKEFVDAEIDKLIKGMNDEI